ncbi:hypothetical protein SAMN04489761_3440 [Tenacibaculum sp. MAR_2009_124]|uniref:hypothetical protein n=1 Tax=Tenacibaculum sp. MAR_2009_124 TaxID=1250059 RepID=UPI0008971DDD|nr:hypothetical protein [Tenacibaculum sp. MAR_2009_124]SEC66492.1 hypothetical protein SAMN04489761_3440 [Tenacibaculum sp. MAR_2009_124]
MNTYFSSSKKFTEKDMIEFAHYCILSKKEYSPFIDENKSLLEEWIKNKNKLEEKYSSEEYKMEQEAILNQTLKRTGNI